MIGSRLTRVIAGENATEAHDKDEGTDGGEIERSKNKRDERDERGEECNERKCFHGSNVLP